MPDSPIEEVRREIAEAAIEAREEERAPQPGPRANFRPASPAAITAAIEEVNRIMESLRQVLDQMEEVLETLELAEVQKNADEREIESLRRSLRGDRRVSGGEHGFPPPRHEPRRPR
jgi:hypothetical protein